MKRLILLLLVFYHLLASAQKDEFVKSEIIDSIFVGNNTNETFTLYLPKQFKHSELSPIVFIFEPGGRGKIGIKPFIKAAEKYGYILVCSNNSKNGPYDLNFEIANRIFSKIFSEFNIDKTRVYTAGFSGGSRLAASIAVLTNQIQGVIACGAGFSTNIGHVPYTDSFSYAAIVGDEDMNFNEMYSTKALLNRLKISNELFVYNFNHKWPSQDQILIAFDWLQLEAYKKGLIPLNEDSIKKSYTIHYQKAKKNEIDNELLSAHEGYDRILRNFKKYFILDSIEDKIKGFKKNKFYRNEKQQLQNNFKQEEVLSNKFVKRFNEDFRNKKYDIKWWESEINKLKKNIEKGIPSRKKMLNRLQYKIFALAIETVNVGKNIEHIDQSIFCHDICILIYPNYPRPYFRQIENYINKNNSMVALNYLEKLLKTGYNDIEAINNNKALKSLHSNKRFIELMKN